MSQDVLFTRSVSPEEAGDIALKALSEHFKVLRNQHKRSTHDAILASLKSEEIQDLISIAWKFALGGAEWSFFLGLEDVIEAISGEIARLESRVEDGAKTGPRMGRRKKAEKEAADRTGDLFGDDEV